MEDEEDFNPVIENDDGSADVDLDASLDDDSEPSGGWRAKKRMRYDEAVRERDEAVAAIENERKARLELEDRVNRFQREASDFANNIEGPQVDPAERVLDELDEERDTIQKEWAALDPERAKELRGDFTKRLRQNETRRSELHAERVYQRQQQRQQVAPLVAYKKQVADGDFPDVMTNQAAYAYADGYWKQQRAKGRSDDIELFKEALTVARDEFGTAPRKTGAGKPSASTKARFSGEGRGAGSGGKPSGRVRMTKEMKEMADTLYEHIDDPAQRYQTWAREIGSKKRA
jgi:anion-transporting  ArsA/GET3 family ATPase